MQGELQCHNFFIALSSLCKSLISPKYKFLSIISFRVFSFPLEKLSKTLLHNPFAEVFN